MARRPLRQPAAAAVHGLGRGRGRFEAVSGGRVAGLVDGTGGVHVACEGVDLGHGEDEDDGEDGEAEAEEEGPRDVPLDASQSAKDNYQR